MTRAKDQLHLVQPHRFYTGSSRRNGDRHIYAPRTRFLPEDVLGLFEKTAAGSTSTNLDNLHPPPPSVLNVPAKLREMWM